MLNSILLIIVILLQIADVVTTVKALKLKDVKESWYVTALLMKVFGVIPALIISKLFVIVAVMLVYSYHEDDISILITFIISVMYIWVLRNNYLVLTKKRDC